MRQLFYVLQFHGRGEAVGEGRFRVTSEAPGVRLTSKVGANGLESQLENVDDGRAEFTSDVEFTGEASFLESGTIRFGDGNSFNFSTIGEGFMGPSPTDGLNHGSIMWRVDGGEGQFAGASGVITSNFTFSADGEAVDNQFGVLWVE